VLPDPRSGRLSDHPEALTNVLKRGAGATATVRLSFDSTSVEVEVIDDGPGSTGGVAIGTRKGLIGMRER
jgi:signal transduction histidine kinase